MAALVLLFVAGCERTEEVSASEIEAARLQAQHLIDDPKLLMPLWYRRLLSPSYSIAPAGERQQGFVTIKYQKAVPEVSSIIVVLFAGAVALVATFIFFLCIIDDSDAASPFSLLGVVLPASLVIPLQAAAVHWSPDTHLPWHFAWVVGCVGLIVLELAIPLLLIVLFMIKSIARPVLAISGHGVSSARMLLSARKKDQALSSIEIDERHFKLVKQLGTLRECAEALGTDGASREMLLTKINETIDDIKALSGTDRGAKEIAKQLRGRHAHDLRLVRDLVKRKVGRRSLAYQRLELLRNGRL